MTNTSPTNNVNDEFKFLRQTPIKINCALQSVHMVIFHKISN